METYLCRVKVVFEILPEYYDGFVKKCDVSSAQYAILKNGVVTRDQVGGIEQRKIRILCNEESAAILLDYALRVYPEAAPAIAARTHYAPES